MDGSRYLQLMRIGTSSSRLGSDTPRILRPGETYTFGVWLRSSSPDTPYTTQLRISGRGGTGDAQVASTTVTVGQEWTYSEVSISITDVQTVLRAEIQASSMPFALDIDGATLR